MAKISNSTEGQKWRKYQNLIFSATMSTILSLASISSHCTTYIEKGGLNFSRTMSSAVMLGHPRHHYLTTSDTTSLSPFYNVPLHICTPRTTLRLPSPGITNLIRSLSPSSRYKYREKLAICASALSAQPPLDLTEDSVRQVLADARVELSQIFDGSVGITGKVELAELDGPFVKISLRGRFWHKRSTVLARVGNYLKQRIPEILEVEIEDGKQLDDSPENF